MKLIYYFLLFLFSLEHFAQEKQAYSDFEGNFQQIVQKVNNLDKTKNQSLEPLMKLRKEALDLIVQQAEVCQKRHKTLVFSAQEKGREIKAKIKDEKELNTIEINYCLKNLEKWHEKFMTVYFQYLKDLTVKTSSQDFVQIDKVKKSILDKN